MLFYLRSWSVLEVVQSLCSSRNLDCSASISKERATAGHQYILPYALSLSRRVSTGPPLTLTCAAQIHPSLLCLFHIQNSILGCCDTQKKVPELCVEYGQQLEFRGKNDEALAMFESALSSEQASTPAPAPDAARADVENRSAVCLAGVTRCTLRSGDVRKGIRLAKEADSPQLFRECASILEGEYFYDGDARRNQGDEADKRVSAVGLVSVGHQSTEGNQDTSTKKRTATSKSNRYNPIVDKRTQKEQHHAFLTMQRTWSNNRERIPVEKQGGRTDFLP